MEDILYKHFLLLADEPEAVSHFKETHRRLFDISYVVGLPLQSHLPEL